MDTEQFLRDCVTQATLALTLTKLILEIWKAVVDARREYSAGGIEYKRKRSLSRLPKNGSGKDDMARDDP
jgi:hypothetical protein